MSGRRRFTILGLQISPVILVGTVVFMALVALAVLPVRTWMNQRAEAELLEAELQQIETENDELRQTQEQLETPAEIERRARDDYGYVYPGEEQYVVEPRTTTP